MSTSKRYSPEVRERAVRLAFELSASTPTMDMGSQMDEHTQMMKARHDKLMSATTPEARQIVMDRQG